MPTSMFGEEVEVVTAHARPATTARMSRWCRGPRRGGTVPSLVFPEPAKGGYGLVPKGTDDVRLRVNVCGGVVTTAIWPG